jgi:RHS repeat-associated protein
VWTDEGISVDFPLLREGEEHLGPWGWLLRRDAGGYVLDKDDGLRWIFGSAAGEDGEWRLSAVEDRCRNRISLAYDGGRLVEIQDSVGRRVRLTRGAKGRVGAVEVLNAASQGRWVAFERYDYDDGGRLVTATDPEGYARTYAYDERNLMLRHTDRVGLSFHYRYDREGRCVETWGDRDGKPDPSLAEGLPEYLADGETRAKGIYHRKIDYMPNGYREVATSRQVRRYFTNQHGLVDKVVDAGRVVSATYDERGFQVGETNELGATKRFERDGRGRLVAETDALERVLRWERDGQGEIVKVTDPAGFSTEITRDARGLPVLVKDPAGAIKRFACDERGLTSEVHHAGGAVARMAYDVHGNLVSVVDRRGGAWQLAYDWFGRITSVIDPLGAITRYQRSARGEVIAETGPIGATARWSHDGEERPIEITDPAGRTAHLTWGGFHWLHQVVDATGRFARARFGRDGEPLEVENARGEKHHFAYDAAYRLVEERFFDDRVIRYRHDAAGQQTRIQPEGGAPVDYTYDPAGQVLSREVEGRREVYTHDVRGFLESVTGPEARVAFERDPMGRIIREIQSMPDGTSCAIDVAYDAEGRPVGRRTSLGHTLSLERGQDERAARVTLDGRLSILRHFDALGREIARVLPGGGEVHSLFDPEGRLSRRLVRGATSGRRGTEGQPDWVGPELPGAIADTSYFYDPSGRLEAAHDMSRGRTCYRRDPAGRLLERIAEAGLAERFDFDLTGNLLDAGPGAPEREHGKGDRLLRRGDVTYHHDAQGRLVEKREGSDSATARVTRYSWNGRGLLSSVMTPEGRVVEFAYDAFARRVEKRVSRVDGGGKKLISRTRFFWDRHLPVHEVRTRVEDQVVEERTYVFEGRSAVPLAHKEIRKGGGEIEERWVHYVNDPLGTPERLLDEKGNVAGEVRLSAWGKDEGSAGTPIRFLGQYADEETGLCYNRHRYYDPEVGRFVSPDPIGLDGGSNSYGRGTDPTAEVDVFGKSGSTDPALAAAEQAFRDRESDPAFAKRSANISNDMANLKKKFPPQPNDPGRPYGRGTGTCDEVAKSAERRGGGQAIIVVTTDGSDLKSKDGKTWRSHWVNEEGPNGPVVDYDQKRVFKDRQEFINSTFEPETAKKAAWDRW